MVDLQGPALPFAVSAARRLRQNFNTSSKGRTRVIRRQDIRKRVYFKICTFGKHADAAWVKNRHYFLAVFKEPNGLNPFAEEVGSDPLVFFVAPRAGIPAELQTCR
jgi:hypothetical protein